ncbi:hypothetical protein Kfla_2104 [Kribbella flavida DSM 17836]|uniref:Uncharacterized protein n=1 Tax=Kribbella flavida (strain DSM 17836 / JCM 10339 / NBRC 14399) TaxID=479435 RepID=D2PS62_KRIFD|nr:hypothetical protein [Kribbella flavida]ADB31186.1 hypothetical protein Kfla_2104 [Kribbella flavida DSM 17836]
MKSSGSVWLVYGVAVVVTFLVGVVAFSVFVLSKVFGGSEPEGSGAAEGAGVVQAAPSVRPSAVVPKVTAARVYGVRAVVADERQVVVVVATPVGCTRFLRATAYAEGPGAVAVRVTQQVEKPGCAWQRKPVLVTARRAMGDRALIVNGVLWTPTANGAYRQALGGAERTGN